MQPVETSECAVGAVSMNVFLGRCAIYNCYMERSWLAKYKTHLSIAVQRTVILASQEVRCMPMVSTLFGKMFLENI